MTDAYVHDTYVKVPTYPDEFKPLLKVLNLALMCKEVTECISQSELQKIYGWKDDFASLALEFTE